MGIFGHRRAADRRWQNSSVKGRQNGWLDGKEQSAGFAVEQVGQHVHAPWIQCCWWSHSGSAEGGHRHPGDRGLRRQRRGDLHRQRHGSFPSHQVQGGQGRDRCFEDQGDWKKLTVEEKKALYRASFCQTLAEVEAPTGEGKSILGCVLVAVSVGIWGYFWMKSVVYGALPDTITSDEKQKAQIDRMIAIRSNPVEGIASNYDYEKGKWK